MKNVYEELIPKARELEKHIDTDWAYEHESLYDDFAADIEFLHANDHLTDAEFDSLASIAFYDYPEGLKGDYDDETFIAEVMALAQPISEYHNWYVHRPEKEG